MLKISLLIFLVIAPLLIKAQTNSEWQIVKRLPNQRVKTLNVDVPPTKEIRPPIIWSMSFADRLNGWAACDDGTLLRTSDGGKTWNRRTIYPRVNELPAMFVNSIGTFFIDNRMGWIIAHSRKSAVILGTEDGGRSWRVTYPAPVTVESFHNLWFADENHGWVVGEADGRGIILGTADGGRNWKQQYKGDGRDSFFSDVKFYDALNGWTAGEKSVLRTTNGGASWEPVGLPDEDACCNFGVDVLNPNEVWIVGSYGRIFHTSNGGSTWSRSFLPKTFEDHWLSSVRFVNKDRGWVAGNDGTIFSTSDEGRTWHLESKGESSYLRGLRIIGRDVFAFGNDGIILHRKN